MIDGLISEYSVKYGSIFLYECSIVLTPFDEDYPFSTELPLHFGQKLTGRICVSLSWEHIPCAVDHSVPVPLPISVLITASE